MLPVYLGFTTGLELWCWVLFISSYYSVLCPMLPVYLGLLCFSSFCLVSNVASISWAHTGLELWCWVLFISSYYSVLCPMLSVYLGLLCFSSFCLVSNVASISWAHNRFRVVVLGVVHFVLLFCLMSNVASISWVVMLLFVLSCVQCCQYFLGSQPV